MGLEEGRLRPEDLGDPASLAEIAAYRAVREPGITKGLLDRLGFAAQSLGFKNEDYTVDSRRAVVLPEDTEDKLKVDATYFTDLEFDGTFLGYSMVNAGRIFLKGKNTPVEGLAIRAMCLVFNDTILLPSRDELPDDKLLHVPVFAVKQMVKTEGLGEPSIYIA